MLTSHGCGQADAPASVSENKSENICKHDLALNFYWTTQHRTAAARAGSGVQQAKYRMVLTYDLVLYKSGHHWNLIHIRAYSPDPQYESSVFGRF